MWVAPRLKPDSEWTTVDSMDEVEARIESVRGETRRRDARTMLEMMRRATGQDPVVDRSGFGFGRYHYVYASGREGESAAEGFAPAKAALTVYLMDGVSAHAEDVAKLGPHTAGVGCLYFKDLSKVDLDVLERIVRTSYERLTAGPYRLRARDGGSAPRL